MGDATHAALVKAAGRWLRGTKRCDVAFEEQPHAYLPEVPDAIGWTSNPLGRTSCLVVECKTSVADCRADMRKRHAKNGETMGDRRWILAPRGVLSVDHLPPLHGLLELRGTKVYVVKHAPPRDKTWARLEAEVTWLRVELCSRGRR